MRTIPDHTAAHSRGAATWFPRIPGHRRVLGAILFLALLLSPGQAVSATSDSVTLAWDASPSPEVTGYRLHHGAASGTYTNSVSVGNVTTGTVPNLASGATYYFAVTALGAAGSESDFSNEVGYTVPSTVTPPVIALTSPLNGAVFTAPATVNLAASVTANGHTITKVQFYRATTLLGEDATAPYTFTWSSAGAGSYSLTARAVYDAGSTVTSAAVNVTVASTAPAVALTAPLNGAVFTAPATVNLAAGVTANGHTITKVQFYRATTLLGEDATAPYTFTWSSAGAGSYSLTARAVYDAGSTVTSAAVAVSVTGLAAPWLTADIGTVGVAGSASLANGTYTVAGAGNLSGTADNFRFVYQSLSGDGEIKGRLNSVGNTGTSARIGVMIRESLTSGSRYAFMGISSDGTSRWQRRSRTGGSTSSTLSTTVTPPNAWVRVVRSGNTLSGYRSTNGTTWTLVDSRSITMATTIYVGLAVASGASTVLNTATYANVTVVP